jgi:hypothetical protein
LSYGQAAQGWHDFYVTAGAAAATLVGLLFVGLSLHIRVVVAHADVRSLARVTLTDFVVVLLVALLLLSPTGGDQTAGISLLIVAGVSLLVLLRRGVESMRTRRLRTIDLRTLAARFGLSGAGYLAVGVVGAVLVRGDFEHALSALLFVVVMLLVVAVRNTWDLLVTVADKHSRA